MKKSINRIIITLLIFIFSFSLVACGKDDDSNYVINNTSNPNHSVSVKLTEEYLMKDGTTDYKILIPSQDSALINFAVSEFKEIFFESTGVRMTSALDNDYDKEGKYISFGQTALFNEKGLVADSSLTTSGFKIQTIDNDIFIYGNNDKATLYGVYEFLYYIIDFECIVDSYYAKQNVKEISLMEYDITEIADIEYRLINSPFLSKDNRLRYMLRQEAFRDMFMNFHGTSHNAMSILPLADYYDKHPKWYAASQTQLSYCAQGDEQEYQAMLETFTEKLKNTIKADPTKCVAKFGGSDDQTYDDSPAQLEITKKYGAESASCILFLNDVLDNIYEWFETEDGAPYKRDFRIMMSAYFRTEKAPAAYNEETGEFEGINGIRCHEKLAVDLAPINIDYTYSVKDSRNKIYYDNMRAWGAVCNEVFLWSYGIYFHGYFCLYDNIYTLQDLYQAEVESNVKYAANQASDYEEALPSAYGALRFYLDAKLQWNCKADVDALIENFFDKYFLELSDDMFEIFKFTRTYIAYARTRSSEISAVQSCQLYPVEKGTWEKPFLTQSLKMYDNAIENIKTFYVEGSAEYNKLYKRIACERLAPLYLLLQLYQYNTPVEQFLIWANTFKSDNTFIGGDRKDIEGAEPVERHYKTWGCE